MADNMEDTLEIPEVEYQVPAHLSHLSLRKQAFVRAIAADRTLCPTTAARRAGYKSPKASGSQLIHDPEIRKAIAAHLAQDATDMAMHRERMLRELAAIAFFNPLPLITGEIDPKNIPEHMAAAISSLRVTYGEEVDGDGNFTRVRHVHYNFHPKLTALRQLAEHLGILESPKLKVNVNQQTTNVNIDWNKLYTPPAPVVDLIEREIAKAEAEANPEAERSLTTDHTDGTDKKDRGQIEYGLKELPPSQDTIESQS